jgi:cyanophycin synthetase
MAREGDLIMIFGDDITRTWKQITNFEAEGSRTNGSDENKAAQSFVEEDPQAFTLDAGEELIRDDRGVRIARNEEEGD